MTDTSIAQSNKKLVQRAFDDWTSGRGNVFADLLAPEARWEIVGHSLASRVYSSREAFMNEVIIPFGQRMTEPLVPRIRSLTAEEDRVIVLFDAEGTARDGEPYRNTYAWFFRMSGGKVVEATASFDAIAFNDLWTRVKPA